jgi:hypothetical protein
MSRYRVFSDSEAHWSKRSRVKARSREAMRYREVDHAVRAGRYVAPHEVAVAVFAVLAAALGVGTAVVAATA